MRARHMNSPKILSIGALDETFGAEIEAFGAEIETLSY